MYNFRRPAAVKAAVLGAIQRAQKYPRLLDLVLLDLDRIVKVVNWTAARFGAHIERVKRERRERDAKRKRLARCTTARENERRSPEATADVRRTRMEARERFRRQALADLSRALRGLRKLRTRGLTTIKLLDVLAPVIHPSFPGMPSDGYGRGRSTRAALRREHEAALRAADLQAAAVLAQAPDTWLVQYDNALDSVAVVGRMWAELAELGRASGNLSANPQALAAAAAVGKPLADLRALLDAAGMGAAHADLDARLRELEREAEQVATDASAADVDNGE